MSALIESKKLRIAMQKSGRLSQDTQALLTSCGLKINLREQRLIAHVENMDIDLLRVRDDDIPGWHWQDGRQCCAACRRRGGHAASGLALCAFWRRRPFPSPW